MAANSLTAALVDSNSLDAFYADDTALLQKLKGLSFAILWIRQTNQLPAPKTERTHSVLSSEI